MPLAELWEEFGRKIVRIASCLIDKNTMKRTTFVTFVVSSEAKIEIAIERTSSATMAWLPPTVFTCNVLNWLLLLPPVA